MSDLDPAISPFPTVYFIAGPTASGKSARAIALAKELSGEIISVDSRQVYRGLDIGTEKISTEEMQGIPHHLIDIREPEEVYSAGNFVEDVERLLPEIIARGHVPILVGGTHFYFDALLHGLPEVAVDEEYRQELEAHSDITLLEMLTATDPQRAATIDTQNRRRLIRALEIVREKGSVPLRTDRSFPYQVKWIVIDPPKEELRARIDERLTTTFERGLIDEVRTVRERLGDERLNELGLEYRIVGEYIRNERTESSLIPALSAKLWHYARRQKAWLRKLADTEATQD